MPNSYINPETLAKPVGYTNVVDTTGNRTIYLSGQVALDQEGEVVGLNDFVAQTRQVFEN